MLWPTKKQTVSINLTLLYIPKKNFKHIYDIALWFRHCIQISYSLQAICAQNDTLMYVSQFSTVTLIFLMQLRCLTFICILKQKKNHISFIRLESPWNIDKCRFDKLDIFENSKEKKQKIECFVCQQLFELWFDLGV